MSKFDALSRLESAGLISGATEEQRQVLAGLSEPEVSTLTAIKERLDAVTPDVQAHGVGGTFW